MIKRGQGSTAGTPDPASLLDDVEQGRISSSALLGHSLLYRAYCAGYRKAEAAFSPALDRANRDADTYYERWLNPGKRLTEVRRRRIDQALAEAADSDESLTLERHIEIAAQAAMPPRRPAA